MNLHVNHRIDRFCIVGLSYKKAEFNVRGRYSVNEDARLAILAEAAEMGLKSILIISTCNRTEIYGYAPNPNILGSLLVKHSVGGSLNELRNYGYFFYGFEALHHAFKVGSGLDSQIIGDFEIAGQMKHALAFSKKRGMVGPILDRTFNFIAQASKRVKNQTALCAGTVSVSFAAIEWLQKELKSGNASILVIGTGKFGTNVMKNLLHYLPSSKISISNRTLEKALKIAEDLPVEVIPFSSVGERADHFDVIITCTNAPEPVICSEYFFTDKRRLLIDLSVPANIHEDVNGKSGVLLVNVDDLSTMLDSTICRRMADVPKAEAIIAEHLDAFYNWLGGYRHAPVVNDMKQKLLKWSCKPNNNSGLDQNFGGGLNGGGMEENIHYTVSNLMVNLKSRREKGCQMIAAYHDFFTMSHNVGLP